MKKKLTQTPIIFLLSHMVQQNSKWYYIETDNTEYI